MPDRTATRAAETEAAADTLLSILADPTQIPLWAPAFADRVDPAGQDTWRVTEDGAFFALAVEINLVANTADYLREIAPGRKGGAYLRVVPRPGGGSVVTMTVPVTPGTTPEQAGELLEQELASLIQLAAK